MMRTCKDDSVQKLVRAACCHISGLVKRPFRDANPEFKTNVVTFFSDLTYPDIVAIIANIHAAELECVCKRMPWSIDEGCVCPWALMFETVDYKNPKWNGSVVARIGHGAVPRINTSVPTAEQLEVAVAAYEKAMAEATQALQMLIDANRQSNRLWHSLQPDQVNRLEAAHAQFIENTVNDQCETILGDE